LEWWLMLLLLLGGLVVLMASGLPVAFCFMLLNMIGVYFFFGGEKGLIQLIHSLDDAVTNFTLVPLPLFVLMGEVMFLSGVAPNMIDALDKWLGRLPGRLCLLAVGGGTLFGAVSGASMASVAMLGSTLLPEMRKRGYEKRMSLGSILGSGGLDLMIPPSGLAVLLGAVAEVSIGKLLIAITVPGLLMAGLYAAYIIGRCWLQPSIAPAYTVTLPPLSQKLVATVKYVLPLGFIIFLVIGIIFLGVATPSEAAATGALGSLLLAAAYKQLSWKVVKESLGAVTETTIMMFIIISGAVAFGQILAYSGASKGLSEFTIGLPVTPILIIIAMQVVGLFLGMFMSPVAIMMITLPMFMPVVMALGFNDLWFAAIFLLNMGVGQISPPFGINLFVMKSVAPPDTTMEDVFRAALPYCYLDVIVMGLMIAFPSIALWLPGLMR